VKTLKEFLADVTAEVILNVVRSISIAVACMSANDSVYSMNWYAAIIDLSNNL